MKIKLGLLICLGIHIVCVSYVNLHSFEKLKTVKDTGPLTPIGIVWNTKVTIPEPIEYLASAIGCYANLVGADRGYEFFSPNIARGSMKLLFVADTGEELRMLQSAESEIKELTAISYLNSEVLESTSWNMILHSICKRFFTKYPKAKAIKVYAVITKYKGMRHTDPIPSDLGPKKVLFSKVQRHDSAL